MLRAATVFACVVSIAGCAVAPPPPVNIVNANASWANDTATCRRYVAQNFVPAVQPPPQQSAPTGMVCNSSGGTTICNDIGGGYTNPFAAGLAQSTAALNRANGTDDRARLKLFYSCMDDMGWRQP